ncbi:MAG: hypothetical protein GC202_02185 [Alphaproteobacteria bacterium]|nr:hypothetical protein [Alphaproteobacteria bacterium]
MSQPHTETLDTPRNYVGRPRTMASRRADMVAALVRLRQETGSASEDDLKRAGFSAAEIDALGDEARTEAAALIRKAGR